MYGISSMRSYVVNRLPHFKHSRRRRIKSPARPSRESTTLSSRCEQNGHFTVEPRASALPHRKLTHVRRALRLRLPRAPAGANLPSTTPRESATAFPQRTLRQRSPTTIQSRPPLPAPFLLQI